jgi:hypothetical protein
VAATIINSVPCNNENPGIVGVTDQSSTLASAADATNGNHTPNNGAVTIIIRASVNDTVNFARPEEATPHPVAIVAAHELEVGPFETDVFGSDLAFKAGLVTTTFLVKQHADLP